MKNYSINSGLTLIIELLLLLNRVNKKPARNIYFKCNAAWDLEHSYPEIVRKAWEGKSWEEGRGAFEKSTFEWNERVIGIIRKKKKKNRERNPTKIGRK